MVAPTTKRAKAWAIAAVMSPVGVLAALSVTLAKAMSNPSLAKAMSKDNNNSKGGDELSQGFLQGIEPSRLVVVAYDNVFHKDQTIEIAIVFFFLKKKNSDHTLAFVFCFVVKILLFFN